MTKILAGLAVLVVMAAIWIVFFTGRGAFSPLNFGQVGSEISAPEIKNAQDLMDAIDALESVDLDSLDNELNQYESDVADF